MSNFNQSGAKKKTKRITVHLGDHKREIYVWSLTAEQYEAICDTNGGDIKSLKQWKEFISDSDNSLNAPYKAEFDDYVVGGTKTDDVFYIEDADGERLCESVRIFEDREEYDEGKDELEKDECVAIVALDEFNGTALWRALEETEAKHRICFVHVEGLKPGASVEFELAEDEEFDPNKLVVIAATDEYDDPYEPLLTTKMTYDGREPVDVNDDDNGSKWTDFYIYDQRGEYKELKRLKTR